MLSCARKAFLVAESVAASIRRSAHFRTRIALYSNRAEMPPFSCTHIIYSRQNPWLWQIPATQKFRRLPRATNLVIGVSGGTISDFICESLNSHLGNHKEKDLNICRLQAKPLSFARRVVFLLCLNCLIGADVVYAQVAATPASGPHRDAAAISALDNALDSMASPVLRHVLRSIVVTGTVSSPERLWHSDRLVHNEVRRLPFHDRDNHRISSDPLHLTRQKRKGGGRRQILLFEDFGSLGYLQRSIPAHGALVLLR